MCNSKDTVVYKCGKSTPLTLGKGKAWVNCHASFDYFRNSISRVPNQNDVSLLYVVFEIHHSGREPSICSLYSCGFCVFVQECVCEYMLFSVSVYECIHVYICE